MFSNIDREPDLTPIWITIYYDEQVQKVTGMAFEKTLCNKGCPFGFILHCVLTSYPEIEKRFPPGILGFTLNGNPPELDQPMRDGDIVEFLIPTKNALAIQ